MAPLNRFQVNAALDRLIESHGADEEARVMIYEFGSSLPPISRMAGSVQTRTPGDSFTAHTPQQGAIQVSQDEEEVKTYQFGAQREGIGNYKIWREARRRGRFRVVTAHFWKLDEGTQSTTYEPQVWCLECNGAGALWFGERATRIVWNHFGLRLGRHEFIEQWGARIGRRHFAGWSIEICL